METSLNYLILRTFYFVEYKYLRNVHSALNLFKIYPMNLMLTSCFLGVSRNKLKFKIRYALEFLTSNIIPCRLKINIKIRFYTLLFMQQHNKDCPIEFAIAFRIQIIRIIQPNFPRIKFSR